MAYTCKDHRKVIFNFLLKIKSLVSFTFILNESEKDEQVYRYTSREPLKGHIEETKSYIKVHLME